MCHAVYSNGPRQNARDGYRDVVLDFDVRKDRKGFFCFCFYASVGTQKAAETNVRERYCKRAKRARDRTDQRMNGDVVNDRRTRGPEWRK